MTRSIDRFRRDIKYCKLCNNLSDEEICPICADRERDHTTVCVVEQVPTYSRSKIPASIVDSITYWAA